MKANDRDFLKLKKIIEHIESINYIVNKTSSCKFLKDEFEQKVVLFDLIQIGEQLSKLNNATNISNVKEIIGLRNIIVHGYGIINMKLIWQYITTDIFTLKEQIEKVIG